MFESARLARRESLPVADLSNANTNIVWHLKFLFSPILFLDFDPHAMSQPPAFDWRDVHGGLTPVKDQGQWYAISIHLSSLLLSSSVPIHICYLSLSLTLTHIVQRFLLGFLHH